MKTGACPLSIIKVHALVANLSSRLCHILLKEEKKKSCRGRNVTLIMHVGWFDFLSARHTWFAKKSNKWVEQYSGQMGSASPHPSRSAETPAKTKKLSSDSEMSCVAPSIIYKSRGGGTSTHLYPLPDGVVRGRPAVLRVVEAGALGRPAGVVLGGCRDLLWGDLPWFHAQGLHAGKICRGQKNSIKTSKEYKVCSPKSALD